MGVGTAGALFAQVELGTREIQLTLSLAALLGDHFDPERNPALLITKAVPMRLRRRGVESGIIVGGERAVATAGVDAVLLKAIARGRRWFADLASNRAVNAAAIARHADLHDSYVRRLLPLVFLAPSIVEAISDGRQPLELSAERLTRLRRLPLDWSAQRKMLGLSPTSL
jgi:site-specific DNA recombinase